MKLLRNTIPAAVISFAFSGLAPAHEPLLAAGQSFALRLSGVPTDDIQQVSGSYTISSAGSVRLPYLSTEIAAVGLRPTELQKKIESAYVGAEIYTHPTVVITLGPGAVSESFITVGGEVRTPGDVTFRPGINLYAAIMRCGGFTEFADHKHVKLLRGGKEVVYDLRKLTADNNPELEAGDQIVVSPD